MMTSEETQELKSMRNVEQSMDMAKWWNRRIVLERREATMQERAVGQQKRADKLQGELAYERQCAATSAEIIRVLTSERDQARKELRELLDKQPRDLVELQTELDREREKSGIFGASWREANSQIVQLKTEREQRMQSLLSLNIGRGDFKYVTGVLRRIVEGNRIAHAALHDTDESSLLPVNIGERSARAIKQLLRERDENRQTIKLDKTAIAGLEASSKFATRLAGYPDRTLENAVTQLVEYLAKVEWAGLRGWAHIPACLLCDQCKPGERPAYDKSCYGHEQWCWFAMKASDGKTPPASELATLSADANPVSAPPDGRRAPRFEIGQKVKSLTLGTTGNVVTRLYELGLGWRYGVSGNLCASEVDLAPAPKFSIGEFVNLNSKPAEILESKFRGEPTPGWSYVLWQDDKNNLLHSESDLIAQTPQHEYQPSIGCVFLGRYTNSNAIGLDLWVSREDGAIVTVHGKGVGWNYYMPVGSSEAHAEACRRAAARG